MSQDELRKHLQEQLNRPPLSPLEATRHFLQTYCYDAMSLDEVRSLLMKRARVNTRPITDGLRGIEDLLLEEHSEGTLAKLVAMDGNRMLNDSSDIGARTWLEDIASIIREVLTRLK